MLLKAEDNVIKHKAPQQGQLSHTHSTLESHQAPLESQ
jgi:hypothetical protein